jgi:hypothetical protein
MRVTVEIKGIKRLRLRSLTVLLVVLSATLQIPSDEFHSAAARDARESGFNGDYAGFRIPHRNLKRIRPSRHCACPRHRTLHTCSLRVIVAAGVRSVKRRHRLNTPPRLVRRCSSHSRLY